MSETDSEFDEIETARALDLFSSDLGGVDRLEDSLRQFNIFESVGATRSEIKHSNFLSWLLDPKEAHGLGDLFLRRFLQQSLIDAEGREAPISPLELASMDLTDTDVFREWQNIDILTVSHSAQLVVTIENKVLAGESTDQLSRYQKSVIEKYPHHRKVFLFLSIDGVSPTHGDFLSVSYETVADLTRELIERRSGSLASDVAMALRHYEQLLRRHYVSDSDLRSLSVAIYRKHKLALDYIFENRPDRQTDLGDLIEKAIEQTPGVVLDNCSKVYIRFVPQPWDNLIELKTEGRWTKSGRGVMFEILNLPDQVRVGLTIGPMKPELRDETLKTFLSLSRPGGAEVVKSLLSPRYSRVWSRTIHQFKKQENASAEEVMEALRPKLNQLLADDVPIFSKALSTRFQ